MAAKKKTTKKATVKSGWGGKKPWKPVEIVRKERWSPPNGQWLQQFEDVFDFAVNGKGHGAVEAVAGSGKTTALVEMAFRYIEKYPTHKVLAIAFNSSIRKELQSRIPVGVECHTNHSLGYKSVIRVWGDGRANFELQGAQGFVAKNLAEAVIGSGKEKEDDREALCHAMSLSKTRLAATIEQIVEVIDRYGIDSTMKPEVFAKNVLWMMNETKKQPGKSYEAGKKAITYDDQVWLPIVNDWELLEKFDLVLIDESQDLSPARTEIARRALKPDGRMIIVGDRFQCVSVDSMINTPDGNKLITDLKINDKVLSYRNGKILPQNIKNIYPTSWTWGVKIITESGKSITMSPSHKLWATEMILNKGQYLIYLMYRKGFGFRVGVTSKDKVNDKGSSGRLKSERGDKLWILNVVEGIEEAFLYEESISLKYSIPQTLFEGAEKGLNQDRIDEIFKRYGQNGLKLLSELHFSFTLPHVLATGNSRGKVNRRVVNMTAHDLKYYTYVSLEWTGDEPGLSKYKQGHYTVQSRSKITSYIRKMFSNYRDALIYAETLTEDANGYLSRKLSTPEGNLTMITANALYVGMKVPVLNEKSVKLESITSIDRVEGSFIDLDVDDASNFFSDGILTHNSIYGFAGSDIDSLPNMIKELDATVLPLTCSFRCAKKIIKEAQAINPAIEARPGAPDGIVDTITPDDLISKAKPGDAVISRVNAPLVKVFFKLAKNGTKVVMLGRDYGAKIAQRVSSWSKKAKKNKQTFTGKDLLAKNDEWLEEQIEYLTKKKMSITNAEDEHETIARLCEDLSCKLNTEEATKEVLERINTIFSKDEEPGKDDGKYCVTLSSTHKFKGLERNRVFLLRDTYRVGTSDEESHLLYVGITRAKNHLTYVRGKFKD